MSSGPGSRAAADRGDAAGHRLDVGDAERLVDAGQDEERAGLRGGDGLGVRERAAEVTRSSSSSSAASCVEPLALRARRRRRVARGRVAVAQQPQRAQDVGVALARDEVADGDERVRAVADGRLRDVGAEVHDAHVARAEPPRALGHPVRVGERQARAGEAVADRRRVAVREQVAAVDGDDVRGRRARRTASPAGAA